MEDKLTHGQRIRLESLSQANQILQWAVSPRGERVRPTLEDVLMSAETIEKWLLQATGKIQGH